MTGNGERFLELKDNLESHPFIEISKHRDDITDNLWTLRRNFDLLKDFTEDVAEDKESVLTGHLSEKTRVTNELYRLTHNYLASYYTQYQLASTFRDSKFNDVSEEHYSELMAKYDIRPTSDFLLGFRNYMQHQGMINQSRHYRWNRADKEEITRVVLFTDDLLEIDRWNNQAEQFIKNQEESIRLVDVIQDHHPDVLDFNDGIWDVAMKQYEDEFEDYQRKRDEMNQIITEKFDTSG
ncbi:hypothetical protein [Halovenus sp. HT40]|uniref:hypothetical protein n=1 Tax=Halovenus sp. HT40 TaxID=3126691 RepID=UPI00300F6D36